MHFVKLSSNSQCGKSMKWRKGMGGINNEAHPYAKTRLTFVAPPLQTNALKAYSQLLSHVVSLPRQCGSAWTLKIESLSCPWDDLILFNPQITKSFLRICKMILPSRNAAHSGGLYESRTITPKCPKNTARAQFQRP